MSKITDKWPYNGIPISQLIKELEELKERLGDVNVVVMSGSTSDNRFPVRQAWGPSEPNKNAVCYIDAY